MGACNMETRQPARGSERTEPAFIRFSGRWSPAQQKDVEAAARAVSHHPGGWPLRPDAPAWVCLCARSGGTVYYLAHWTRRAEVLTARSVDELIEKIRQLPDRPFYELLL